MEIQYNGDMKDLLSQVKTSVYSNDGVVKETDLNNGTISVSGVEVSYSIKGNAVKIKVLDKPFFISESYVEDKIKELFKTIS